MEEIRINSKRDYFLIKKLWKNIQTINYWDIESYLKEYVDEYEQEYKGKSITKCRTSKLEKIIDEKNHYIDTLLKANMRLRQEQTKYNKGLLEVRSVEYDRAIAQKALELAIEVIRHQEIDGRNYYEVIKDYYKHFTSKPEDLILSNFDIEVYFVDMAKEMIEYDN